MPHDGSTTLDSHDEPAPGEHPERELTHSVAAAPDSIAASLSHRPDVFIVLTWLVRLRWFALLGQGAAIVIALVVFDLELPLGALIAVMAATAVTNLALVFFMRYTTAGPQWLVFAVLLFDVIILTAMLALTGGRHNPFCLLYLIHVAMAVVVLPARWVWTLFGESLAAFSLLFVWFIPLKETPSTPKWMLPAGTWAALAIASGLIAYFIGRLRLTLRMREEQMAAMQSRMTASQRLASLTTLAAGAAHELGTPLGTIALVSHELQQQAEKLGLPAQAVEDVRLIRDEVDRCRRILDRMHIDSLHQSDESPVTLASDELINEIKADLKPGQAAMLDVTVSSAVSKMTVRRSALTQTLGILIQNAFDASEMKHTRVSLTIESEDGNLVFTVKDQGEGMSSEQLRRIGEPFVTTKGPQRGLGLGLFLARLMAEHLRGSLKLRSALGKGTTCVLRFPRERSGS
ncbi:MAG: ATP-binding protein [Phycisphaeraceae bacterium]